MTQPSTTPRILIVEDEADTRELLRRALARAGFDVVCAAEGLEAVTAIYQSITGPAFDAVVLDCAMAPMDGFTIAKTIRLWEKNLQRLKRTRIAFYTAYPKTVERSTLLAEVEADAYWEKPLAQSELPQLIRQWLASVVSLSEQSDAAKKSGPDS